MQLELKKVIMLKGMPLLQKYFTPSLVLILANMLSADGGYWKNKYSLPELDAGTYELKQKGIDFVTIAKSELVPVVESLESSVRAKDFSKFVAIMSPAYRKQLAKSFDIKNSAKSLTEKLQEISKKKPNSSYESEFHLFFSLPEQFWNNAKWAILCWSYPEAKKSHVRFIIFPFLENSNELPLARHGFAFRVVYIGHKLQIEAEDFGYGELEPFHSSPG